MTEGCHMVLVPAGAGWFDPSTITSLIPLWLVVLIADGLDPSITFSLVLNVIWCSNPVTQSKPSSNCWVEATSFKLCPKGEVWSSAMDCGESL